MKKHSPLSLASPTLLLIILTPFLLINHSGLRMGNAKSFPSIRDPLQQPRPFLSPQNPLDRSMAEAMSSAYNRSGLFAPSAVTQATSAYGAEYIVVHQSTLSVAFINHVLAAYHSPAQGKGWALEYYGQMYGIDPAYALAFFMHESSFGRYGMATVTKSLGNIRCTAGYQCYGGFRQYETWEAGFVDWYQLIRLQYVKKWHLETVDQIVPTYAPSSENDVDGYIYSVEHAVDTWRDGDIRP